MTASHRKQISSGRVCPSQSWQGHRKVNYSRVYPCSGGARTPGRYRLGEGLSHGDYVRWTATGGRDAYRAAAAGLTAASGILALFVASLLVCALQLRWVPIGQGHGIAIAVLAFAIPLQTIACVYGFLCRDVVASTGMGYLLGPGPC